ncbi:putative conserved membrane protein [Mycobacterium intracellulare subsp. yongonense]|uniref:DUF4229 domain-containing protein n=1 Tax=Mycobacterium intracellulare TaxID=1767 RepID=UPI000A2FD108|nr:DUF4229 domain-containing protein [Mycobacterium intracellulare]ARR80114.1 putative conserved membrane protein [Mycobacterium intracellulare subsp. yongonense]ARR85182.1 hypothetical protein MOTT27_04361 [Mycobacterium intracellulare subsp. yongonense]
MSHEGSDNSTGGPGNGEGAENHVVVPVLAYMAARLLLAVVLTAVIYGVARLAGITQFPLVVAALFALIIAMPLGIWVFGPLRRRATAALAIAGERRRRERELLQARLHGDAPPDEAREDG